MKLYIKTAHGYLSFQPGTTDTGPVKLEYRQSPGVWEDIELEITEMDVQPPPDHLPGPGPDPGPPPDVIPPAVQPVERSAAYISRVKDYLLRQGKDLSGPCGAFTIVEYAVWWLLPTNPTVGTLYKPAGNNCKERSTDIVMFSDQAGAIVDVLGDGGGANQPTWNTSEVGEVALDRWRAPARPW